LTGKYGTRLLTAMVDQKLLKKTIKDQQKIK